MSYIGNKSFFASKQQHTEHTNMYVVFESRIWEIEDEMSTELLFCTGVKIEDIFCRAFNPINFH